MLQINTQTQLTNEDLIASTYEWQQSVVTTAVKWLLLETGDTETHLERDTANWQINAIFQHVQIFSHKTCWMNQTLSCLCIVTSL